MLDALKNIKRSNHDEKLLSFIETHKDDQIRK